MNKKEINEIKKNFSTNCGYFSFGNVVMAMVSNEGNIFYKSAKPSFAVSNDEIDLIIEALKKTLTGKLGKNLREYSFIKEEMLEGGKQSFLYNTLTDKFSTESVIDEFLHGIVSEMDYESTYAIISAHCCYSVLNTKEKERKKNIEEDAESVFDYNFIITAICPVNLKFEGLIYDDIKQIVCKKEKADRILEAPSDGFLFPLFNDRAPDVNGVLYYTKTPKKANVSLVENVLGCQFHMDCESEKEAFNYILKNVVGDSLDLDSMTKIQQSIQDKIDSKSYETEAVMMDCNDISAVLWEAGVEQEKLETLPATFNAVMGETDALTAGNLVDKKTVISAEGISVSVSKGYEEKVKTEVVNGKKCIIIEVDDPEIVINGVETKMQ